MTPPRHIIQALSAASLFLPSTATPLFTRSDADPPATVYRGDSRPPAAIKANGGFHPWGEYWHAERAFSLENHLFVNEDFLEAVWDQLCYREEDRGPAPELHVNYTTAYVSTTTSPQEAAEFASGGWVYIMQATPNMLLLQENLFDEVLALGGVYWSQVRGFIRAVDWTQSSFADMVRDGRYSPNPDFDEERWGGLTVSEVPEGWDSLHPAQSAHELMDSVGGSVGWNGSFPLLPPETVRTGDAVISVDRRPAGDVRGTSRQLPDASPGNPRPAPDHLPGTSGQPPGYLPGASQQPQNLPGPSRRPLEPPEDLPGSSRQPPDDQQRASRQPPSRCSAPDASPNTNSCPPSRNRQSLEYVSLNNTNDSLESPFKKQRKVALDLIDDRLPTTLAPSEGIIPEEIRHRIEQGIQTEQDCMFVLSQLNSMFPMLLHSSILRRSSSNARHCEELLAWLPRTLLFLIWEGSRGRCPPCQKIDGLEVEVSIAEGALAGTWDTVLVGVAGMTPHLVMATGPEAGYRVRKRFDLKSVFGEKEVYLRDVDSVSLIDHAQGSVMERDKWTLQGVRMWARCAASSQMLRVDRYRDLRLGLRHGRSWGPEVVWSDRIELGDWRTE
ncbi:putative enterotoxin [Ophiocordyceps camponoti-rufipedis]|uniref:Putative enterotoxin n=1 Tax=Ophiocordyceps camponoti-rufipedis TaxID=2004952 RepID=A0A2C5Z9V5_9HYPO|nr:putative enterotoxin [Ophiocordyceps camponoti-rufipedis]